MSATISPSYVRPLTAVDRCDRCSARAVVSTVFPAGGELLWCNHHYSNNSEALFDSGAIVVVDERHSH